MIRAILEESLLFLAPFIVFGLILVLTKRNPFKLEAWSNRVILLAVIGLACVIAGLVVLGVLAERPTGVFEPAHMENGRLVPGRFH